MGIVNTVTTLEQLAQEFDGLFERRVFRLEALDYYDAENEHEPYARFLAGQPVAPAWREPWKARVRAIRESGRTMQRVHIVSEPLTDYIRFSLLHGYPANVEAGEDVRILSAAIAPALAILRADFWLFDDGPVALLEYDKTAGSVKRVKVYSDPEYVAFFRKTRDATFGAATPLAQYVAEHNITNERTQAA